LVLVTVVLALLLTATIPRFHLTAQRLRVEASAFELAQLLRAAREQAVVEGRSMTWAWDAAARRARVEASGATEDAAPQTVLETAPLPESVTVTLTRQGDPVDCACVRFFPGGTSESTTLTLDAPAALYTATVDEATGHVVLTAGPAAR